MTARRLRLGVAGLGRAFTLMLPTFTRDARLALVAAADPRPEARHRFAADFGGRVYDSVEALCGDREVDAVYVATPHQFHAVHAIAAARAGKHVLVEKPMAVTLEDCSAMIAASKQNGVRLVVGPSHSFDAPIAQCRQMIASGSYGRLRMILAFNYTDFLYRLRRPEELDTAQGGGAVFNQGSHQVDIVRFLSGGITKSVRAVTGDWDPSRPAIGAYSALLEFAGGVSATITYSGYGHFDSDELCNWIGESGVNKDPRHHGAARRLLRQASDTAAEITLKQVQNYGGTRDEGGKAGERLHDHFGFVLASCEKADLRPTPRGVMVHGDEESALSALGAPKVPRREVIDELHAAVVSGREPVHSGEWGMATVEVCLAILRSAAERREIALVHQTPVLGP